MAGDEMLQYLKMVQEYVNQGHVQQALYMLQQLQNMDLMIKVQVLNAQQANLDDVEMGQAEDTSKNPSLYNDLLSFGYTQSDAEFMSRGASNFIEANKRIQSRPM